MALQTEMVYLYPKENAEPHNTINYELVHDEQQAIAVLRRGKRFTMAVRFMDRDFNEEQDEVQINFNYGNLFFFLMIHRLLQFLMYNGNELF